MWLNGMIYRNIRVNWKFKSTKMYGLKQKHRSKANFFVAKVNICFLSVWYGKKTY